MQDLRRRAGILVGFAVALLIPLGASGQSIAYVQGSRVGVRSEPSTVGPIVNFLTTNTIVAILERGQEWCRIRSSSTASLSGFVPCRLLSEAPLTRDFVRTKVRLHGFPDSDRLDWLRRRFWIAPSLRQLRDVGEEMTSTMLSQEHLAREDEEGQVRRPVNPEFNAMKARLSAGVVPDATEHYPQATAARYSYPKAVQRVLKEAPVPPLQPSFFRRDEPLFVLALSPLTLTEQGELAITLADALSAANRIPLRARTFKPAGYSRIGPIGTWDISSVGVQFDKPVMLHGITARGEPTGLAISSIAVPIRNQLCMNDVMSFRAKPHARWNSAIVGWVGKSTSVTASVTTTTISETANEHVTRQEIDLNGDTVADFLVLTGRNPPDPRRDLYWKAVFANVDGRWILVADAESKECT